MTADPAHLESTSSIADRLASRCGVVVLLIAGTVLAGWALGNRTLTSFYPGWVTMKPNTAFALGLSAAAVLVHGASGRQWRWRTAAARAFGLIVLLIGALTLAEYAFGISLGIDQLLVDAPEAGGSPMPGRMAAVSALAFVFLGCALMAMGVHTRRGARPAQPLAVAAGALGLAALLGYLYGAISAIGNGHGIQIAMHTSISLVLVATGIVAREAGGGWLPTLLSPYAGGALARRLLPLAFFVPVGLGALRFAGARAGIGNLLDDAAVVAVCTMFAFAVVVWRTAHDVNEFDAQWRANEQDRLTLIAKSEASHERAAAERAAREAAERAAEEKADALTLLDLVLDSNPVGVAFFDRNLSLLRANPAFSAIAGVKATGTVRDLVTDAVPEGADAIVAEFRHVLATGEAVINAERGGGGRSGRKRRHWLSNKYPVRNAAGDIIGVGLTLVDTTDRKQLEAQLQQSQKMEAIGQLAGGVAHDFNNVLTAIKSFSELVALDLPIDSPSHDDVQQITAAAERAAALTRHLLAFSRRQLLQPVVLDPNSVIVELTKLLARLLGGDVRCETMLATDIGRILADPGQLEQVLINLAVNARDAMPSGGTLIIETFNGTVEQGQAHMLSVGEPPQPGDYVVIAVSDNGHGMDAQTQARIFEPFFTTKEPGKGTGLGLSTVYGIVRQTGGYVSVYSAVGRGTTFRILLPIVRGDLARRETTRAYPGTAAKGSETILVVDDDQAVRAVAMRILTRAGYHVLAAATPGEAMSICATHPAHIHLLITDLMMPEMNGGELARSFLDARQGTRVLYTSGYTNEAVIGRGLIGAGTPFLAKPFTIEDVTRKVRETLAPG